MARSRPRTATCHRVVEAERHRGAYVDHGVRDRSKRPHGHAGRRRDTLLRSAWGWPPARLRTLPGTSAIRTIGTAAIASVLADGEGHRACIGGGFIEVEAAASARMKGLDVMAVPESRRLGAPSWAEVATSKTSWRTTGADRHQAARAGLQPGAGGHRRQSQHRPGQGRWRPRISGVLVDEHLSAGNDIWAVGDIAEYQMLSFTASGSASSTGIVALNQGS